MQTHRSTARQPTLYLPHGGGACFVMKWTMGPPDTWNGLAEWLGRLPATLSALLVISAHWEEPVPTVLTAAKPALLYDYPGSQDGHSGDAPEV
jgi:aromatic ring-opening dioxygenase catalytic subunit (LigB family)